MMRQIKRMFVESQRSHQANPMLTFHTTAKSTIGRLLPRHTMASQVDTVSMATVTSTTVSVAHTLPFTHYHRCPCVLYAGSFRVVPGHEWSPWYRNPSNHAAPAAGHVRTYELMGPAPGPSPGPRESASPLHLVATPPQLP